MERKRKPGAWLKWAAACGLLLLVIFLAFCLRKVPVDGEDQVMLLWRAGRGQAFGGSAGADLLQEMEAVYGLEYEGKKIYEGMSAGQPAAVYEDRSYEILLDGKDLLSGGQLARCSAVCTRYAVMEGEGLRRGATTYTVTCYGYNDGDPNSTERAHLLSGTRQEQWSDGAQWFDDLQSQCENAAAADVDGDFVQPQVNGMEDYWRQYVEIRMTAAELAEKLPGKTPYTEMYITWKSALLSGNSQMQAAEAAEAVWRKNEAVRWYAEKHGLTAGRQQVDDYLAQLEQGYEDSEDHPAISAICKKLDITFGQWLELDRAVYETHCTETNVYQAVTEGTGSAANEMWEEFLLKNIKAYEDSPEYRRISPQAGLCAKYIRQGRSLTAEELSQADIFI